MHGTQLVVTFLNVGRQHLTKTVLQPTVTAVAAEESSVGHRLRKLHSSRAHSQSFSILVLQGLAGECPWTAQKKKFKPRMEKNRLISVGYLTAIKTPRPSGLLARTN